MACQCTVGKNHPKSFILFKPNFNFQLEIGNWSQSQLESHLSQCRISIQIESFLRVESNDSILCYFCPVCVGWSMKSSLVNDIDKVFRACLRPFIACWNLIASHWELVYQQLKTWKTVVLTTKNPPYCVRMYEKSLFDLNTGYDLLLMNSLLKRIISTAFFISRQKHRRQFPLYQIIFAKWFSNLQWSH